MIPALEHPLSINRISDKSLRPPDLNVWETSSTCSSDEAPVTQRQRRDPLHGEFLQGVHESDQTASNEADIVRENIQRT